MTEIEKYKKVYYPEKKITDIIDRVFLELIVNLKLYRQRTPVPTEDDKKEVEKNKKKEAQSLPSTNQ